MQEELAVEEQIVLPTGSSLITVGGIEIAQNAVWSGLFYVPVLGLCGVMQSIVTETGVA